MQSVEEIIKKLFDALRYNITVNRYTVTTKVPVERGCNGFQVTNLGTSVITVNGITLFPSATPATVAGDSIIIGGNVFETYKGDLTVVVVLPAGATPLFEVLQKFHPAPSSDNVFVS